MAKLFILVGIPGTGKSTWAKTHHEDDVVVSSDAIREELFGDITNQSNNREVFDTFHTRILSGLERGNNVIADSTALDKFARTRLLKIAYEGGAESHLVVFDNIHQGINRNLERDRVVPQEAMERMLKKYEEFRGSLPDEAVNYKSITEIGSLF